MKRVTMTVVVLAVFLVGGMAQAYPMRNIVISEAGVGLPSDFQPGAEFDLLGDNKWGTPANQWGTVIGGPSMSTISWEQDSFFNRDVVVAFAMFETGAWGDLSKLPELMLNGENIGTFGSTAPGLTYARDFFMLDPELVTMQSLNFSFDDPRTGGTGWNNWYELGVMYKMTVFAVVAPPSSDMSPVPEPSTIMLFGIGMMGLAVVSNKRSNKKA